MRPNLLHPRSETRRASRRRRRRGLRGARRHEVAAVHQAPVPAAAPTTRDSAAGRVREAGGPVDHASYVCSCGFAFAASVSTSVACPHCGAEQAW
jgi:hypothetical protein